MEAIRRDHFPYSAEVGSVQSILNSSLSGSSNLNVRLSLNRATHHYPILSCLASILSFGPPTSKPHYSISPSHQTPCRTLKASNSLPTAASLIVKKSHQGGVTHW